MLDDQDYVTQLGAYLVCKITTNTCCCAKAKGKRVTKIHGFHSYIEDKVTVGFYKCSSNDKLKVKFVFV